MDLILYLIFMAATIYYIDRAGKGKSLPGIRTIAALEAIKEGVGRAVEIRKPVHFSFGASGATLSGIAVAETIAGVGVLSYCSDLCARLSARMIFHLPNQPQAIPLLEGAVDGAYQKAGKVGDFNKARDMRFYGYGSMVFASGQAYSLVEEGVALNVVVGQQTTLIYPVMEAAKLEGAINVGGTARWTAMYVFALTCDYMFIGEEIYAAGAKVADNPYMTASIAAEEILKYVMYGIQILLLLLRTAGVDIVTLLKM